MKDQELEREYPGTDAPPELFVRLLGSFAIFRGGKRLRGLDRHPKVKKALIFLLVSDQPEVKTSAINLEIWGDGTTTRDFRTARTIIKRELGPGYLVSRPKGYVSVEGIRSDYQALRDTIRTLERGKETAVEKALAKYDAAGGALDPLVTMAIEKLQDDAANAHYWLAEQAERDNRYEPYQFHLQRAAEYDTPGATKAREELAHLFETTGQWQQSMELVRGLGRTAQGDRARRFKAAEKTLQEKRTREIPDRQAHGLTAAPDLVGRDREVEAVAWHLRRQTPVTVTGVPGAGKSALAVALAWRIFPNYADIRRLDLGDILGDQKATDKVEEVGRRIARAAGLTLFTNDWPRALARGLMDRHLLLILDNCHAVTASCATIIAALQGRPGVRVLATSRRRLGVEGEQVVPLRPLPPVRAGLWRMLEDFAAQARVKVLVRSINTTDPVFALVQENARDVNGICNSLDGWPGTLVRAGEALGLLGFERTLVEQPQRLAALVSNDTKPGAEKQRRHEPDSWKAVSVPKPYRGVFLRLAVFDGGWRLDAADKVCADARAGITAPFVLEAMMAFAQAALVQRLDGGPGGTRYRMPDAVREVALAELRISSRLERDVRNRHRKYYADFIYHAGRQLTGAEQDFWYDEIEAEYVNIRQALAWYAERRDDIDGWLETAGSLHNFWRTRGYYGDGERVLRTAIEAAGSDADQRLLANALFAESVMLSMQDKRAEAVQRAEESLAVHERTGNLHGQMELTDHLGTLLVDVDLDRACAFYERSLALAEERERTLGPEKARMGLAYAHHGLAEALRLRLKAQDEEDRNAAWETEFRDAVDHADQALALWDHQENAEDLGRTYSVRADLMRLMDEAVSAARDELESMRWYRTSGDLVGMSYSLEEIAEVLYDDAPEEAIELAAAARSLRAEISDLPWNAEFPDTSLAAVEEEMGTDAFRRAWRSGWHMAQDVDRLLEHAADAVSNTLNG